MLDKKIETLREKLNEKMKFGYSSGECIRSSQELDQMILDFYQTKYPQYFVVTSKRLTSKSL